MYSSDAQYMQRIVELDRQFEQKIRDLVENNAALDAAQQASAQNALRQEKRRPHSVNSD